MPWAILCGQRDQGHAGTFSLQYDFKFPNDQGLPKGLSHSSDCMADAKARVLFKARTPEVSLNLDNSNHAK